jgi:hypothetical protein
MKTSVQSPVPASSSVASTFNGFHPIFMEDDVHVIPIYRYEAITPEGVRVSIGDFNIVLSKTVTKTELEDAFD